MIAMAPRASAYEFEVSARAIGEGSALRAIDLLAEDPHLARRQFELTLSLDIWDLGRDRQPLSLYAREPENGPRLSISTYLRIRHDFGPFTSGQIVTTGGDVDAIDLIPELAPQVLSLDVLYAYFSAENLADHLDLYAGRQLETQAIDMFAMDGLKIRLHSGHGIAFEAFGGALVRAGSPLGDARYEPDGTSAAECAEYVEGPVPGSGAWRPIDRPIINDDDQNPFANDFDRCPQRDQLMPTFGGAVALDGIRWLMARLAYRRSMSASPGLIGPADRFDYPDTGYYPNELGQAPSYGVNHEALALSARSIIALGDGNTTAISPFGGVRYSLLHGIVDTARAGVTLRAGSHFFSPEIYYAVPTFDGDSIFNVFGSVPQTDMRLRYELAPHKAPWRGFVLAWVKRFSPDEGIDAAYAGGAQIGARVRLGKNRVGRAAMFSEGGYGGTRTGGYAAARWQLSRDLSAGVRANTVVFGDSDGSTFAPAGVVVGGQLGATYRINQGIAVHAAVDESTGPVYRSRFRALAVLDLAFWPEH